MRAHQCPAVQDDWARHPEESLQREEPSGADSVTPPKVAVSRSGLVVSVVALTVAAATVTCSLACGLIQVGVAGIWFALVIPVTLSSWVFWLCMKQSRREADVWKADLAVAVRHLATEDVSQLRSGEPLSEVLVEVAEALHTRVTARLSDQEEELKTEAHRDLLRVRGHCEQLIEQHAERLLRDKNELAAALQQKKDCGKQAEGVRDDLERALEKESGFVAELRERVTQLEGEVAQQVEELARVLEEVKQLDKDNANLKLENVKFFDKMAAQIRGSIKIVNKLLREMSTDLPANEMQGASGRAPRPVQEYIAEIASRAEQLDRVIGQVLDLCRLESTGLSLVYSEVDTGDLLRSTVSDLFASATANDVNLTSQVPPVAPIVTTDARLLERIIREISVNAIRFTPKGGRVILSVSMSPDDPPGGQERSDSGMERLQLTIRDTGPGISPEDQGRIFGAFERGNEPQFTMVDAGAGLGLTLSRHYATLLGGELRLDSQEGWGSQFTFELPVKVPETTCVG